MARDFNASRDFRPFRAFLATGFLDCADPAEPILAMIHLADCREMLPGMRLDHIPGLAHSRNADNSCHTSAPDRLPWRASRH
jgi:hypothetical protein